MHGWDGVGVTGDIKHTEDGKPSIIDLAHRRPLNRELARKPGKHGREFQSFAFTSAVSRSRGRFGWGGITGGGKEQKGAAPNVAA